MSCYCGTFILIFVWLYSGSSSNDVILGRKRIDGQQAGLSWKSRDLKLTKEKHDLSFYYTNQLRYRLKKYKFVGRFTSVN